MKYPSIKTRFRAQASALVEIDRTLSPVLHAGLSAGGEGSQGYGCETPMTMCSSTSRRALRFVPRGTAIPGWFKHQGSGGKAPAHVRDRLLLRTANCSCQEAGVPCAREGVKRTYFGNSGAEAVEAAFKLAVITHAELNIAFFGAFHGRTMGALSLTASKTIQKKHYYPVVPESPIFLMPIVTAALTTCAIPTAGCTVFTGWRTPCSAPPCRLKKWRPSLSSRSRGKAATCSAS